MPGFAKPGGGLLLDGIEFGIGAIRVMMEQHQVFDLGGYGQLPCLKYQAMSPAMLGGHIAGDILGIMDQDIGALTKCRKVCKRIALVVRRLQFIIGKVDDRFPRMVQTIPHPTPWVIDGNLLQVKTVVL